MEYFFRQLGFQASDVFWRTHAVGNDHGKLAGNACKKYIRFCSCVITGGLCQAMHILILK